MQTVLCFSILYIDYMHIYACSSCFQKYQTNMKVIKGCFSCEKTAFMKTVRGLTNTKQEKVQLNPSHIRRPGHVTKAKISNECY